MVADTVGSSCAYTVNRTYTISDECGNSIDTVLSYTVRDTTPPVLSGAPADLTLYCDVIPAPPTIGVEITATDNCDDNVSITFSEVSTQTSDGTCSDKTYTVTRTWYAADDCGTLDSLVQTIRMLCECCDNGIDDDEDGLIDGTDPECPCESNSSSAQCELFYYYVPPITYMEDTRTHGPSNLVLTTPYTSANVTVRTADNTTFNQTYTVVNGTATEIPLTTALLQTPNPNTAEGNRGFIIESDQLLQVYYRLDGELNKLLVTIKGEQALGTAFRTGSQTKVCGGPIWAGENHFISVMAVEDNTVVSYEFVTDMFGLPGRTHSVTLNAGETYLVKDDDENLSITGSLVTSDKPIAVLSGSMHTPVCDTYGREGGVDQLVPTCLTASEYILVKGYGPTYQNYAVAVAVKNDTEIWVDGTLVATLNAGESFDIDLVGPLGQATAVSSDKPIYLYHLSGISTTNGEVGMALVAPVGNCSGDRYVEFPKFAAQGVHAAYVIVPDTGLVDLQLNGNPYTDYTTATAVAGYPGYSTVWFEDGDLQTYNTLTS
ncbi:MAG: IgGFc-binding protein, partial [Bacteroidota bacterium]